MNICCSGVVLPNRGAQTPQVFVRVPGQLGPTDPGAAKAQSSARYMDAHASDLLLGALATNNLSEYSPLDRSPGKADQFSASTGFHIDLENNAHAGQVVGILFGVRLQRR